MRILVSTILLSIFWIAVTPSSGIARSPFFKQVSHPFMPAITSEYFYFTKDGLMWFSSANGLTSFDGTELVYYSSGREAKLFGLDKITALLEDENHNLYIGGSKLVYYDRNHRRFVRIWYDSIISDRKTDLYIRTLFQHSDGTLYIGTESGGMFTYDATSKNLQHYSLVEGKPSNWIDRRLNTVASFAVPDKRSSTVWVGTFHGIYQFDLSSKKFSQNFHIVTPRVHAMLPELQQDKQLIDVQHMILENDSIIWFNSWAGGFARYNSSSGKAEIVYGIDALHKSKDRFYGYIIPMFTQWEPGKFLLGIFDPHAGIYDVKSDTVEFIYLQRESKDIDEVRYVSRDPGGNVWVLSKGLLYATMPGNVRMSSLPSSYQMRGIYFDMKEQLYYAAAGPVHVFDNSFQLRKILQVPLFNNYFTLNAPTFLRLAKDGNNRLWASGLETYVCTNGMNRFDHVSSVYPSLRWIKSAGEFIDVISDKHGDILLYHVSGRVYKIDHRSLTTDSIRFSSAAEEQIRVRRGPLKYDSIRHKIYSVANGNIYQYDLNSRLARPLPLASICAVQGGFAQDIDFALAPDGTLWFLLPAFGIRIVNPDSFRIVDSIDIGERGLTRGDLTSIRSAGKKYMVFQSLNGLVVYDREEERSILIDQANGLSRPVAMSINIANNQLFASQRTSIEYFSLDNIDDLIVSPRPALNYIISDSSTLYLRSTQADSLIAVNHNQNTLQFSFSALEFLFPERIEYAYQLVGADRQWRFTNSTNRHITYTSLPPGKYTFRLKAQMQGDNWQQKPVEYKIIIKPAFWQTWFFRVTVILLILAMVLWLMHRRLNSIRLQEKRKSLQEKKLLELEAKALRAQMNPHFIFNSLNSIKSLINKNDNDAAVNYLTTFSKLIRTLFQNSDKREVTLFEELETCKLYAQLETMRFGEKIRFEFDSIDDAKTREIKVPALVIQPFIENAIWHGLVPKESGGTIKVVVQSIKDGVQCIVDDDGIGREISTQFRDQYAATHQSKGIGLTRKRLQLDKQLNDREDSVEIIDKKDDTGRSAGTKVILTFKDQTE